MKTDVELMDEDGQTDGVDWSPLPRERQPAAGDPDAELAELHELQVAEAAADADREAIEAMVAADREMRCSAYPGVKLTGVVAGAERGSASHRCGCCHCKESVM